MFYIFSLLYHIFLLISYRIKIYIQYHYVYYIYTLCLYLIYLHLIYSHLIYSHLIYSHLIYSYLIYSHLIYSHLIYSHLIYSHLIYSHLIYSHLIYSHLIYSHLIYSHLIYSHLIYSHLIYSHLIYSHLIYSHLIYSHLIYLPFDIFTIQIHFYNIPKNPQMCPAHRDLPTPTHPHSRLNLPHPIPSHTYNGLKTISLPTTPSGRSPPSAQPSVSNTAAYRHKSTKLPPSTTKHSKKSPRGVQRGRGFAAPLRFSYFRKKILRPFANPNETQYFSKVFFYILLLNNTYSVHSLDLLEFI